MSKYNFFSLTCFCSGVFNYTFYYHRIVSRFYEHGYFEKGAELRTIENHHALPYIATVPSFLFFVATFLPLVFFPGLRLLWLQSILLFTMFGYLVLAIKSVC